MWPSTSKGCKSKNKDSDDENDSNYVVEPLKCIVLSQFRQESLDAHNKYRLMHCCPPLEFCPELNEMALQWAVHLASKGRMQARHFDKYGENLYLAENFDVPGDIPVKRWYDENKYYEYAAPKYYPCAAHFTQLIWKNAKELGVGVCINRNKTYVVAYYYPAGNIPNHFKENVPRPTEIVRVIQGPPPELGPLDADKFIKDCLDAHNRYRALHGCPPLKLNAELSAFAMEWAKSLADRGAMEHREDNQYGENLYLAENVEVPGELPVKRWYDEIQQYNFKTAQFAPNVGHFTQVVWKNTTDIGIAVLRRGQKTYCVANYNPPGNFQGQFREMVPPPKGQSA